MKFSFVFLILTFFLFSSDISLAGDFKSERSGRTGYLKKDRFDPDRTIIYHRDGSRKGYLKKDPFDEDRTNIFDRDGSREGYLEHDRFFEDRTNIYKD